MIGGNGWCGWPSTGGGAGATHAEYPIHANNMSLIPAESSYRNDAWNGVTFLDQDSIVLGQDSGAAYNLILNSDLDIADPGIELLMAWEEETGGVYGNNFDFKAGVNIYEKNQTLTIVRDVTGIATSDSGTAAEEIIITDLTANLNNATKPSPLTAPPYYAIVYVWRGQDEVDKDAVIHSLRLRHKII